MNEIKYLNNFLQLSYRNGIVRHLARKKLLHMIVNILKAINMYFQKDTGVSEHEDNLMSQWQAQMVYHWMLSKCLANV